MEGIISASEVTLAILIVLGLIAVMACLVRFLIYTIENLIEYDDLEEDSENPNKNLLV